MLHMQIEREDPNFKPVIVTLRFENQEDWDIFKRFMFYSVPSNAQEILRPSIQRMQRYILDVIFEQNRKDSNA